MLNELQSVSRINVIALSLLRYLALKNEPVSAAQLHLEWSFCNVSEQWDMNDSSIRQLLTTMSNNALLEVTTKEKEKIYRVAAGGYRLMNDFLEIDTNILAKKWSIKS
jgi:DNA-binding PadR family transcriptional regulator